MMEIKSPDKLILVEAPGMHHAFFTAQLVQMGYLLILTNRLSRIWREEVTRGELAAVIVFDCEESGSFRESYQEVRGFRTLSDDKVFFILIGKFTRKNMKMASDACFHEFFSDAVRPAEIDLLIRSRQG